MMMLELLKSQPPGAETLVLIISDVEAQRVMMAWTFYGPDTVDYPTRRKETAGRAWTRLWEAVEPVDFEELARLSNVPQTRCERIFYRLKRSNLVYPDGTMAGVATQLLSGQMMAHIHGFIGRKKSGRA